jgi:hypothetical protein
LHPANHEILAARGPRSPVDPWIPYAFLSELEYSRHRQLEPVSTIFLTGRECRFHCLMCDLWKHTTVTPTPPGAIPAQIDHALQQLPPARHIKLYNASNFFDDLAIPRSDWSAIAARVRSFDTVIVENHPRLCGSRCDEFQQLLGTQLEVALGLETSHPATLARLTKQMTVQDFKDACGLLQAAQILIRVFILLRPPGTTEAEGIRQALDSIDFAFDCGAHTCSIIPVRPGNGILDHLERQHLFARPKLSSLETVLTESLTRHQPPLRIFADLWNAHEFADDPNTALEQINRIEQINHRQSQAFPGCQH